MTEVAEALSKLSLASNGNGLPVQSLLDRIDGLLGEVNGLISATYEIQELRHVGVSSTGANGSSASSSNDLNDRLTQLDASVQSVSTRIVDVQNEVEQTHPDEEIRGRSDELQMDWNELSKEYTMLKEEVKDEAWLVRFRTTADQAEGMMLPLQTSLASCLRYVEQISTSPVPVPFESELEELPSIQKLQTMAKAHDAMKRTYVPSISKILKLMDKSISERSTKNGEALRRYSEMSQRWFTMQRQLQQLEARIRMVLEKHLNPAQSPPGGHMEMLADMPSPPGPSAIDYLGTMGHPPGHRNSMPHRSSVSSGISGLSSSSAASWKNRPQLPRDSPTGFSPDTTAKVPPVLKKRTSVMSNMSNSTAKTSERAPWNSSPRLLPETHKTPTSQRFGTMAGRFRPGATSPSPGQRSESSSRIPVLSPTASSPRFLGVPPPSSSRKSMTTPEPGNRSRPSLNSANLRQASGVSSMGGRSVSGSVPRNGRAPPSSFRSMTPTPQGRPSSRMSMGSQAVSAFAPPSLQPFQPSKYDMLDLVVQGVMEDTGFDLFVSRLDPSLKKGQRRGDKEEWRGEFVFGAGQKISSVKLLQIAGRVDIGGQGSMRTKCLVKVSGAWQDLATLLRQRKAEAPQSELESP